MFKAVLADCVQPPSQNMSYKSEYEVMRDAFLQNEVEPSPRHTREGVEKPGSPDPNLRLTKRLFSRFRNRYLDYRIRMDNWSMNIRSLSVDYGFSHEEFGAMDKILPLLLNMLKGADPQEVDGLHIRIEDLPFFLSVPSITLISTRWYRRFVDEIRLQRTTGTTGNYLSAGFLDIDTIVSLLDEMIEILRPLSSRERMALFTYFAVSWTSKAEARLLAWTSTSEGNSSSQRRARSGLHEPPTTAIANGNHVSLATQSTSSGYLPDDVEVPEAFRDKPDDLVIRAEIGVRSSSTQIVASPPTPPPDPRPTASHMGSDNDGGLIRIIGSDLSVSDTPVHSTTANSDGRVDEPSTGSPQSSLPGAVEKGDDATCREGSSTSLQSWMTSGNTTASYIGDQRVDQQTRASHHMKSLAGSLTERPAPLTFTSNDRIHIRFGSKRKGKGKGAKRVPPDPIHGSTSLVERVGDALPP